MTFCKVLATAKRDDDDITAYEKLDQYASAPRYEIVISRGGIARLIFSTAKTTWKSKFKYLANIQ